MTKKTTQLLKNCVSDSPILVDQQEGVRFRGFALAFDRVAKASTFVFNAKSSNCTSKVTCSLLSFSLLLLESVTNLFKP